MIIRRLALVLAGALAAAMPASAGPGAEPPLPATPEAHAGAARAADASIGSETHSAWMWVATYGDSVAEACVDVTEHRSDRYEFGCGPVELTMDPVLNAATIRGTIPSMIYTNRGEGIPSELTVYFSLEGIGVHQAGAGQGSWVAPPYLDAGAGAMVWRPATGTGRVDSSGLCSETRSRSRRSRGRRTGAACSPGTGTLSVRNATLWSDAGAWVSSGSGECGESIRAAGC